MKTKILLVALLACCGSAAFGQGVDLTAADAPDRLLRPSACATKADLAQILARGPYEHTDARIVQPWRPPPNVSPEEGGGCWAYSNGNYDYGVVCSNSPYGCINQCLANEQSCVQSCYSACGNVDNTNGSCFESCGDVCRNNYNNCATSCG